MDAVEKLEKLHDCHKPAFRTAFDYLEAMWPPVLSVEFFQVAAARMKDEANAHGNDKLTNELLMTIYTYLEYAAKVASESNE